VRSVAKRNIDELTSVTRCEREEMKRKTIAILCIVVVVVGAAGGWLWLQGTNRGESDGLSVPPGTLVFRAFGGTETMYFIFQTNSTYSLLARMHMGTMEYDHGTWKQNESGEMTLTSQRKMNKVSHLGALRYKSHVALYSPDQNFIKTRAASAEELKSALDKAAGKVPFHVFTQVSAEGAAKEASTPQPFIFYPELNKPRPHSIELQKGSPLAPNKASDATSENK
jgi:hypothetical protein